MGYITEDYYRDVYMGEPAENLGMLIARASDIIDDITMMRIGGVTGLDRLSPVIAERVRRAVAAEAEFLASAGGAAEIDAASVCSGFSIGKFSVSGGSSSKSGSAMVSNSAVSYLEPTGLLYRGV